VHAVANGRELARGDRRSVKRLVFRLKLWQDRLRILMRKSREVPLTLLAAAALASVGCHNGPQHCVDAQNHLMPDSYCHDSHVGYRYVYGGSSGGHYGDSVVGSSSSSVSFGGFGHGGGEGGE
jgi:hypothetical protein